MHEKNASQSFQDSLENADLSTYASILTDCASARNLVRGKLAHGHYVKNGHAGDVALGNRTLQMYARCGNIEDAGSVLSSTSLWDVYSWTAMITANAQRGHFQQALQMFHTMDLEGVEPNSVTLTTVLSVCSNLGDKGVRFGVQVHERIVSTGIQLDVVVGNILISMYGKCNKSHMAREVFDSMPVKDVISWNSMISTYAQNRHGKEALELFHTMEEQGGFTPNAITYVSVLGACTSPTDLSEGRRIHHRAMDDGLELDNNLGNAVVHTYAKCGSLEEARAVFDKLSWRHAITWSVLMGLYTQRGHTEEALKLMKTMELEGEKPNGVILTKLLEACGKSENLVQGKIVRDRVCATGFDSDVTVATAVISMFSKCGDLQSARDAFDTMRAAKNVVSWNAMISAYAQHGQGRKALELYRRMEPEGVKTTESTYLHALSACSGCRDLHEGKLIHARARAGGFDTHLFVGNALVNMYAKCNQLEFAREAFERIHRKDIVSWNTIIAAYSHVEHNREALEIYWRMESDGLEPTKITLVHALTACLNLKSIRDTKAIHEQAVRSGLDTDVLVGSALVNVYGKSGCLKEARSVFSNMRQRNVVSWSGMIAALSEHGRGKEAINLFQAMDLDGVKPNEITLLSVLDACASSGAITEGRKAHTRILSCGFDSDTVVANSLINMYGKCGHIKEARSVFDSMPWRNVVSWTGMLAGYAQHGYISETMQLFKEMSLDGSDPNFITFVSVLFNSSHAGVVKDGVQQFHSMVSDFGIAPITEHYSCIIDLLGRAGWLDQAEELILTMPVQPDQAAWNSLLGACKVHSHSDRAVRIARHACDSGLPFASAHYVFLSNIYSTKEHLQEHVDSSLIEVKGRVHEFVTGKTTHPRMNEIAAELQRLCAIMKQEADAIQEEIKLVGSQETKKHVSSQGNKLLEMMKQVREVVQEQEMEQLHCVRMAIAYGLVTETYGAALNIVNDRTIRPTCHVFAKWASKIVGRKILVRDSNRFHHFERGVCSCGDYC